MLRLILATLRQPNKAVINTVCCLYDHVKVACFVLWVWSWFRDTEKHHEGSNKRNLILWPRGLQRSDKQPVSGANSKKTPVQDPEIRFKERNSWNRLMGWIRDLLVTAQSSEDSTRSLRSNYFVLVLVWSNTASRFHKQRRVTKWSKNVVRMILSWEFTVWLSQLFSGTH